MWHKSEQSLEHTPNCTNRIEFIGMILLCVPLKRFFMYLLHWRRSRRCCRSRSSFFFVHSMMKVVVIHWMSVRFRSIHFIRLCEEMRKHQVLFDCQMKEPFTNNQFLCYTSIFFLFFATSFDVLSSTIFFSSLVGLFFFIILPHTVFC